jgi:hypothetical protein
MLVGYMRVSKADGSQTTNLQRHALLAATVDGVQLYDDHASGNRDDRPGLAACLKALRDGDCSSSGSSTGSAATSTTSSTPSTTSPPAASG